MHEGYDVGGECIMQGTEAIDRVDGGRAGGGGGDDDDDGVDICDGINSR